MTGIRENETMDKVALVFSISYVSMADQEFGLLTGFSIAQDGLELDV